MRLLRQEALASKESVEFMGFGVQLGQILRLGRPSSGLRISDLINIIVD